MAGTFTSELAFGPYAYGTYSDPAEQQSYKTLRYVGEEFDPLTLFGSNDRGVILDFSDEELLFQNSGGTGAVAIGDPVGYATDAGPLGKNAIQATAANRPIFSGMARELGAEVISNGRFDSDTVWAKGDASWTIGSGRATKTAGIAATISQTVTTVPGQIYLLFFNSVRTAGTLTARLTGGTTFTGSAKSVTGSWCEVFIAQTGNTTFEFSADATFAGSVDNATLKPITTFVNKGVRCDGTNDKLTTAAVDLSNGNILTVVISVFYPQEAGNFTPIEVGNYYLNTPGSFTALYAAHPQGRLRGSVAQAQNTFTGGAAVGNCRLLVSSFELDPALGTIQEQIKHRLAGVSQTGTTGGALAGAGNLVNGVVTIGAATTAGFPWKELLYRVLVINRALSASEKTQAEGWVKSGMVYCAVIGDSTSAFTSAADALPTCRSTDSLTGGIVVGAAGVAAPGDKIADQKTKWTNIADKSQLETVIIQIGLNDCNTYGATKTTAQITADLQDLVDTVNAAKPVGCKVYVSQMTPARAWLGVGAGTQAQSYALWQGVNDNIAGTGPNPITGVDGRITGHVADLKDGSDNLLAIYDYNADGVHISSEARFIVGQYWRAALETAGLLS